MLRVEGENVKVEKDSTGGMVSVDWYCPHCGNYNASFFYSSDSDVLEGDFETNQECSDCGETVTIECRDAGSLF